MVKLVTLVGALPVVAAAGCISSGDRNTINNALRAGVRGTVVQLCENSLIKITDQISFTAEDQEISTQNYPTGGSRATIQVAPGSAASTLIAGRFSGIKIKNVQLNGNRGGAGFDHAGGANIEIGGQATGQVVSNVASRNPRGWSCLHVIGFGNDGSPWPRSRADGISLDCTESLVQGNSINGPTDGGIVIFGSPGSIINNNTITSSPDYLGLGTVNMVDGQYQGSYSGVKVTNNRIQGNKIFNLGIGIGANAWSFNDPYALHGPAEIAGNSFSGHIVFPVAINGWTGGITVTRNDASGVTKPKPSFSDASHCVDAIQQVFNQNADFVYFPAGMTGSKNMQPEFIGSSGNMTNFLCSSLPLSDTKTFQKGQIDIISDPGPFADLHDMTAQ